MLTCKSVKLSVQRIMHKLKSRILLKVANSTQKIRNKADKQCSMITTKVNLSSQNKVKEFGLHQGKTS